MTTQEPADPDSIRPPERPARPDAREAAAVFALAMSAFVLNLNSNVMGALLPFLRGEFGFDDEGGARLLAAAGAGSAVGALLVADAGRRLGRRTVLVASLGLFVVASVLHLLVTAYWPLLLVRALSGLALGLAYAAASAAVADLAPYERR
ncbi:MAG: MFS transporter, partial [Planctomycetes bacterium]|nr:MFS transporter [Planctomycetota bacterium]